jgi:hypothetical protein
MVHVPSIISIVPLILISLIVCPHHVQHVNGLIRRKYDSIGRNRYLDDTHTLMVNSVVKRLSSKVTISLHILVHVHILTIDDINTIAASSICA